MRMIVIAITLLAIPSMARSQQDQDIGANLIRMLRISEVRENLDLEDYQVQEVTKLIEQRAKIGSTFGRTVSQLPLEQRRPFFEETKQKLAQLQAELPKVLLPKQLLRLEQIELQVSVNAASSTVGLTDKKVIDELKLTPEQIEAVKKDAAAFDTKIKERVEAFRKELATAKQETRRNILNHLTDEQRATYARLLGEVLDFSP